MTAGEWREWQRRYRHEVSRMDKDQKFYDDIDTITERAVRLCRHELETRTYRSVDLAYAVRAHLKRRGYKATSVHWYEVTLYQQGVVIGRGEDTLITTTNKHAWATFHFPFGLLVQHGKDDDLSSIRHQFEEYVTVIYTAQQPEQAKAATQGGTQ
jgi:hypothetical protein